MVSHDLGIVKEYADNVILMNKSVLKSGSAEEVFASNEFKQSFSEAVIDFVGQYYPTLRGSIDRIYTATPLTYRDYTSTPDGSAYGIIKDCRNPLVTMIPTRTRIANLLLAGQSVNIHGCLGTTITSAVACGEIVGTEYLAKKIGNA